MNWPKKLSVRILIIFYGISYLLQNSVFIDRKKVYAAETPSTTNLVAVFVDKNIYQDIKANLVRYTTTYIQKKIANSKAVVFPIDTTTLKAHEISQILENMYFEWLKDQSSKLVGTILIGDIPLPVVENNGFIYPSIFPYVDFENQEFVYDANKKFFVYNNNPNGQAELWHGIIKFDTPTQYNDFFTKIKSYNNNPTTFIDKAIWYEDFIGLKKYFIPENTKYYINSMIFAEDIGYHRFNNLFLNILKDEHNDSTLALGNNLQSDLQNVADPDLKAYANDMAARNNTAAWLVQQSSSNMPTLTLQKATQEMLKGYDGLISSQFLAKIKDNIGWLARRYKTTEGETFTDYSSVTDKIVQKDNRIVGDSNNNVQPLLIQINDYLENGVNDKIQQEKYYMTTPIPVSELDFEGKKKGLIQKKCTRKTYNYYENYFFGTNANSITSAEQTNIYKGTFQNLTSISGQTISNTGQSIGGSYKLFSTQIEANRGYDFNTTKDELDRYAQYKTNKQSLRQLKCTNYFLWRKRLGICMRPRSRSVNDSSDGNKCNIADTQKQWWCESLTDFSVRNRWWWSPLSMDSTTQKLKNYDYRNAVLPIYDIAGAKKIDTAQPDANSYKGAISYTNMIQEKFGVGDLQHGSNNIWALITNPASNGSNLVFTNQLPVWDLENPTWTVNPPKTYAQTNFFTLFTALPYHIVNAGKAVLYSNNPGDCGGNGNIYTYKTIDSRVKNISPTRDQISDTEFYKFKDFSTLNVFYTTVIKDLAQTKADIVQKNEEFSWTDSLDVTGVVANLRQIKNLVASGNNGMQQVVTFNPTTLLGYTPTQITQLLHTRTGSNLNWAKILEINNRITKTNEGLESLLNYMDGLNIKNVATSFANIVQSEGFKNQKVEILDTRKSNITQNIDYITMNINALKTTFTNARGIYNTIGQLNNNIVAIQAKKVAINAVVMCGSPTPIPCWCDITHYKVVCDTLDNILGMLQTNLSNINDSLTKIHVYLWDNNEFGVPVTVQPFVEINQLFSDAEIFWEVTQTKATMNTFTISTDPEKKEKNKGMNLTTQDRPIDNIRNITFQGIGWDTVRLNYPNLYEVQVYKKVNDKLILKGTGEIREAIKTYLTNKAIEYNTLLQAQQNKKNQYYQSFSAQFNFLGQLDALANPNTHNYNLLPTDYFINQIVTFLDTLQNAPEYGKQAIYGNSNANTINDKLDMIAKLLHYQNSTRPERLQQTTVAADMTEIKDSFDINQKISQVTNTYLTEGSDQGKFITPIYDTTGYEVGYINSDGEDYISSKPTPAFIKQIQSIQENIVKAKTPVNQFVESSAADLQAEVDSCEWVDTQGTALLFDFKTFSSPWGKAMVCWAKKILKKPFDIKISFANALGPVVLWVTKELKNTLAQTTGERKEYGAQRTVPNNDEIINQANGSIKDTLQGYNNYAIIHVDKTIIGVDDNIWVDATGNAQIKIGMAQDMGKINVKISWTGDNCFGIMRGTTTLSEDICTKKAQEYYNPNTEDLTFEIVLNKKTAGSTALMIELCPAIGNVCITRQEVINIIPGQIDYIQLQSPKIVMEWAEIPVIVSAQDSHGNSIGQSIQAYTISVNSGDGQIYDGASANASIKFDNFATSSFIYQAPIGIKENKNIIINVLPDQIEKRLWADITAPVKVVQQIVSVVKGVITVLQNNIVLYQTNITQAREPKINFTLPKDETAIQYSDTDGIPQIKPENIPSLVITVKDKNGNALDTVANITSKQGILIPWSIKEKSITNNNITKKQAYFTQTNNFVITSGQLNITLYPSFKAGNDTITINIPGIDPITIPVTVNPWAAKTVLLKLEKSRMDLTTTTGSKWTINVVDSWNNKVTSGTVIKLWVIGSANSNVDEFVYSGNEYTYTITATGAGGEWYVFAYIKDRILSDQTPWYERFIIQDNVLPKDKLNVMYLNLFWTDRGNQRWYFSENNKVINTITDQSNKLLATTTQLVDPSKIKQIEYIIDPHGQIQSINTKESTLTIENKGFIVLMPEIAKIHLGSTSDFKIQKIANTWAINEFTKDSNTIVYIPEPTDSVVTGNEATKAQITINGIDIMDLTKGTIDTRLTITTDNETLADMSTYIMTFNGKNIGKLMIWNNTTDTTNPANIDIQDPITYGQTTIFSEWSTNTQGRGIYINSSAFTKQWYTSIEDSTDALLGIWFTSNFKNIANFANGKSVGESTLPYGSQFLINFWDPLLGRREKNPNIPNTDFDASIGQTIYADPNKTIFKVLPIDFNNDGLKDLMVVYTDGVIKLLKNYWGTHPYRNLQELMIIAEPIKDIKIGDVDGNGYDDIFVITTNNKGIVYLNDKWVFPVDGKNVCLNVNAEPDMINPTPDDFSNIKQMFVQDMDKDGKLDIVTNDSFGDIKIFYGGSTNGWANYLSSVTWICDSDRYTRQKDNYKIVKRFGIKINSNRYIQDGSLIHRKWTETPMEWVTEEKDIVAPDTTAGMTQTQQEALKTQTMSDIKTMVANTDSYVAAGTTQLAYTDNPLSTAPTYESLPADQITYLPINETNDAVSVYKEYADVNGWVLRQDDEVVIKTTIISKKNNNKLTYIDQLQWPWSIAKDDTNKITSFVFGTNNTWWLLMDRNGPEGYQFVIDNIQLNSGESLSFSYKVNYQAQKQAVTIDIQDTDLLKENKQKDGYPDIAINSTDSCQKNRWIFFNDRTGTKKTYEQIYDDIQAEINNYNSWAKTIQQTAINNIVDQLSNVSSLDWVSNIPGMSNLEGRNGSNILSSLLAPWGISQNINILNNYIDGATANVSKKLDAALQWLCQWFTLGKWWCQWVPVPFNQAFLAPGDYHIFWCVPQLPNPLYSVFRTINTTIGKGMPVLNIPATLQTPLGPIPFFGIFGFPQKWGPWETDDFFLGAPWGIYPSLFRLYVAPTLTLGLGIAMCFGPYSIGKILPKPFRDLGGNCIVFAVPPLTSCPKTSVGINQPSTESLWSSMVAAAGQWTCNNPPKIGNTIVFAGDSSQENSVNTASSPLYLATAFGVPISAWQSSENSTPYSSAIPQGNFGWIIQMDQDPIKVSASQDSGSYDGYVLKKWETINLKIVGAKTKGLVKCMVQTWMTNQIQYIQNNLTKMTIQIDLPDVSTVFQWFDKIGNLEKTYQDINAADTSAGYIQNPSTTWGTLTALKTYTSKKYLNSLSQKVGNNPFEAIQQLFKEVPLINIDTKDLNIKIPALTSDDIIKYVSYLKIREAKNSQILEDWTSLINQTLALCGTTDKAEAQDMKAKLETEKAASTYNSLGTWEKKRIDIQINQMNAIIALPVNSTGAKTRKEMGADTKNIRINAKNTATKIATLPYRKVIQIKLQARKVWSGVWIIPFWKTEQTRLDAINGITSNLEKCSGLAGSMGDFMTFQENTAGLISSVKQNINVLEKYKEFPGQLYQWTHLTDRYLTEISSLLSNFVGGINSFLSVNATRFSQYVDAITLIIWAIKTWQAIIDFSVNRSERCSKCSNDNYGSFSCSLSFLCPKLPIFPIPAFKIPNIYMDISHIELGMNIVLPKINFVPIKIPLPQLPDLPEPPTIDVDWNMNLNINLFKGMSLPTIPVIPEPPTLPEPPSFIPSIKMDLPVLPPAPKIPKILPEINAILKVADFIGKIFCIVKWGIGLVGEKWVKGKIEQLTQRTWNVPVFDYFNLTTNFKSPPLQWFDYKLDAYTTLKFNFDGVYDVFNSIANITNGFVSKQIETPIQKTVNQITNWLNNNPIMSWLNNIGNFNQNINVNVNGYNTQTGGITGIIDYKVAYTELTQGLTQFKNSTTTDKKMNDRVKTILATVENKSTVLPATDQIEQVEKAAQSIINGKIQENKQLQKEIWDYNTFIKKIENNQTVLVDDTTLSTSLTTPLLTIDSPTKNILQTQEDPTKTYLDLNKRMVQGYLDAVNNDGAEKLNMSPTTYKKSKTYLETTKEKIDTALLAYTDTPVLAQGQWACTNCSNTETNYSTDISSYVQGVFIESYSGNQNTSGSVKNMVNTVSSSVQLQGVQQTYTTNTDLNNDKLPDILMYDANSIYIKYAKQESENFSKWGNTLTTYYNKFYSYENEHPSTRINPQQWYIKSLDQMRNNSDAYGYMTINDITIKVVDKNKEPKNFKTDGQTFDNLELSRQNSDTLWEPVDGYIIKVSTKIDDKDTPSSFRDILGMGEKPKYIIVLPQDIEYTWAMITVDQNLVKKRITSQLGNSILSVEQYDPAQTNISLTLKNLPRKWLYTSLATLTNISNTLTSNQQKSLALYTKTSPRSNQTVAGMQNLWDMTAPVGDVVLWRNITNEAISTGLTHEWYINTNYTLKSVWTDNVVVAKMIIQKDGKTILEKNNTSQTGTIDLSWLFFTWATQQDFDFIAIDQNNNITKERVTVHISIPDIQVIDVKKSGDTTADIIAKISNDLDEGTIIFQRLRNGIRKNIEGTNQNAYSGFSLSPKQTIITGGIFTMGNDIGMYDTQGNEIATINPKTGEIKISKWYENTVKIHLSLSTHIPVVELRDITKNITLFQIVLPIEAITNIEMNQGEPNYQELHLTDGQFGNFNGGYCIKNNKDDCIIYTNSVWAIYIPGIYASSLGGEYIFDTTKQKAEFIVKDQVNSAITTLTLQIKASK